MRRVYGLDERASTLVRSGDDLAILAREGRAVQVVELGGTLFFGSAYRIFDRVRRLLPGAAPSAIVLDFTRVVGGDSSTTAILARMRRLLAMHDISLTVSGAAPSLVHLMRIAGAIRSTDAVHVSTDAALEASEFAILARFSRDTSGTPKSDWLTETLGDARLATTLLPHLVAGTLEPGAYLCRQGEPTTSLLFIERGRVAVTVGAGTDERTVRVFGPRTITGEHGFVLARPRTANLRVEEAARVWSLERDDFERLREVEPGLVIALLERIVGLQSERLAFATRQNAALA